MKSTAVTYEEKHVSHDSLIAGFKSVRDAQDEERMSDVLASLQGVEMTLSMLQESKIGASVSKLKKHTDERVSNRAKALIKAWKKVAEMSGVQGAAKMERPASSKGMRYVNPGA